LRILLIGAGAVGARAARQLVEADDVGALLIAGSSPARCESVAASSGTKAAAFDPGRASHARLDAVVLAGPSGTHLEAARTHLAAGRAVVSTSDDVEEVRALLDLDAEARERGLPVVVGAGFSPGMTCLLARHAAADLDEVDEVHVARTGTGGPACARAHHRALGSRSLDWRDHAWQRRPAGSGRELCWFPDPIGAQDCYRAALPDALLLVPAFDGVGRVTARMAATRRDRLTAWAPMLRRPHPEGLVGAVRVEVRGRRGEARDVRVLGALDRPAVAAGAVAALAARAAARGELAPGAAGLANVADPVHWLAELARIGIKAAVFEGG
jgi:saccharopine dehydrogenase-like NADP-dependent oxidoreductase